MKRNYFTEESYYSHDKLAVQKLNRFQSIIFMITLAKSLNYSDKESIEAIKIAEEAAFVDSIANRNRAREVSIPFSYNVAALTVQYVADPRPLEICNAVYYTVREDKTWDFAEKIYSSIYKEKLFPKECISQDIINIAKDIYSSRNVEDFPILADALEDNNYKDDEILHHLRYNKDIWNLADWSLNSILTL